MADIVYTVHTINNNNGYTAKLTKPTHSLLAFKNPKKQCTHNAFGKAEKTQLYTASRAKSKKMIVYKNGQNK